MIRSWRNEPYSRAGEPKRFWASLLYNVAAGAFAIWLGATILRGAAAATREAPLRAACVEESEARAILSACDRWVGQARLDSFDLGLARGRQADAVAALGDERQAILLRRAAIAAYGRSLDGYPDDSAAYWNSALLMEELGELGQAREALRAHTELEPDRGEGWLRLGMVEVNLRQFPDAIVHLTRAIDRLPGEAGPLAGRAIAYRLAGDRARADADMGEARRRDPDDPVVQAANELFAPSPGPGSG